MYSFLVQMQLNVIFFSDQVDYDEIASITPKTLHCKSMESDISLMCNQCKNEKLEHFLNEMYFLQKKIELACSKSTRNSVDRLVFLLHGKDYIVARVLTQSNITSLNNNYLNHLEFVGIYLFLNYLGFSPK